jgi:hypothetical protein
LPSSGFPKTNGVSSFYLSETTSAPLVSYKLFSISTNTYSYPKFIGTEIGLCKSCILIL